MKNFPHQFNDLGKLLNALGAIEKLIEEGSTLSDDNFGTQLTSDGVYAYRDKSLSIEQYLRSETQKLRPNRGYLTVSRDIRRLFQLLGFLTVFEEKHGVLSPAGKTILRASNNEEQKRIWRDAFLQLGLEGTDGAISHPYRILLRLVQANPGIETQKLMLALEAENDSEEEFERILALSDLAFHEIITSIGTTPSMARNATKILPGIAEQLNDITRRGNHSFPLRIPFATEDEIEPEMSTASTGQPRTPIPDYRAVNADEIARDPVFGSPPTDSFDLSEAIRIRQSRLAQHQSLVRQLGLLCEQKGFQLYEGKFDCCAISGDSAILFEVKTILDSKSDQEKQTVKGIGQLKYYKFSIIRRQMGIDVVTEVLVFSQKPQVSLIDFCMNENVMVLWVEESSFKIYDGLTRDSLDFDPLNHV